MPKLPSVSELMVGAQLSSVLDRSSTHPQTRQLALSPRLAVPVSPQDKWPSRDHAPPPPPPVPATLPHPRSRNTSFLGHPSRQTDYFLPHPGLPHLLLYEQPAESPLHVSPRSQPAPPLAPPLAPLPQATPQIQLLPPPQAPQRPQTLQQHHLHQQAQPAQPQPQAVPQHLQHQHQHQHPQAQQHPQVPQGPLPQGGYGPMVPMYPMPNYYGLPPLVPVVPQYKPYPREVDQNNALVNKRRVIKRRTRTGCLTCRKRRIKCDERKPHCYNCERSKKLCLGYEMVPQQAKRRNLDNLGKEKDRRLLVYDLM
ncbi:hypothetical protein C7M61_004473 [Candidozyma pseudohaemuli]|uniref:Zn(2)-C6 fungal-type domain-containing protein n=1 Tax=Candidozyma pseudohaemuli TaxID=418784 RepID=A0A2P7YIA3_9ASCO|nr:hypothetical protein C7M61_004473 [[Candida] pseudohaemulonii]PSK35684.1 hypothetical protein C7M61_004473 [[Candida] pseudohaemulonii]